MTGYERVRAALEWKRPDRVPKGELGFEPDLCWALAGGCEVEAQVPRHVRDRDWAVDTCRAVAERCRAVEAAARSLGADLVGVWACEETWRAQLEWWAGGDLFVWGIVDGPFQGCAARMGWERALLVAGEAVSGRGGSAGASQGAQEALASEAERTAAEARLCVQGGADGVVVGEDVAYTRGLMVSEAVVEQVLVPLWSHVTAVVKAERTRRDASTPLVVFHSDGAIHGILAGVAAAGFDGAHSMEPEAGIDLERLVGDYRGLLGFMGGLSVDLLASGSEEEVSFQAARLTEIGRSGGLVVGTTTAFVPSWVPVARLRLAYRHIT